MYVPLPPWAECLTEAILYHVTKAHLVYVVTRDGLRPRKATGQDSDWGDYAMDDRVYLWTSIEDAQAWIALRQVHLAGAEIIAVSGLDLELIAPDEEDMEIWWDEVMCMARGGEWQDADGMLQEAAVSELMAMPDLISRMSSSHGARLHDLKDFLTRASSRLVRDLGLDQIDREQPMVAVTYRGDIHPDQLKRMPIAAQVAAQPCR